MIHRFSLVWLALVCAWPIGLPSAIADEPPRGAAQVEETRPASFPHRIWAACDFEAQTYDWFGPSVTGDVPA